MSSLEEVANRRQMLAETAYQSVLQSLFVRAKTDAKFMLLMQKLRKELNITPEQHKGWLQQLQAAKQSGTLAQTLMHGMAPVGGMAPTQQYPAHNQYQSQQQQVLEPQGVSKHRAAGPTKRKRTVVLQEDSGSDITTSAGGGGGGGVTSYMATQQPQQPVNLPMLSMHGAQYSQPQQQHMYASDYNNNAANAMRQSNGHAGVAHGGYGPQGGGQAAQYGGQDKKKKAQQEPVQDIEPLVGYKVQRYWPKEGQWFEGIITDRRAKDGLYCITYQLGKKDESMEWFDIEAAAAVGNAQLSHYQLTPEKLDMRKYMHTRAYQNSSVLSGGLKGKKTSLDGSTGSAKPKASKKRSHMDMY